MYSLLVDRAIEARLGLGKLTGWEAQEAVDKDLATHADKLRMTELTRGPIVKFYDPATDPWVKLEPVTSGAAPVVPIIRMPPGTARRRDELRATWGLVSSTENMPGGVNL